MFLKFVHLHEILEGGEFHNEYCHLVFVDSTICISVHLRHNVVEICLIKGFSSYEVPQKGFDFFRTEENIVDCSLV